MSLSFQISAMSATFLIVVSGCMTSPRRAEMPIDRGPTFLLTSGASDLSSPQIPVEIVDQRPEWQKFYYSGSNQLRLHDWAITFVPLENVQPSFNASLIAEITRQIESISDRPASIEVRLSSFQLVYDESKQQQVRFDQKRKQERLEEKQRKEKREQEREKRERESRALNQALGFKTEDKERPSFGEAIVGIFVGAIFQTAFDTTTQSLKRSTTKVRSSKLGATKPPGKIRNDFGPGLTCEVAATVDITWNSGHRETGEFRVLGHPQSVSVVLGPSTVTESVEDAIQRLAKKVAQIAVGSATAPSEPQIRLIDNVSSFSGSNNQEID